VASEARSREEARASIVCRLYNPSPKRHPMKKIGKNNKNKQEKEREKKETDNSWGSKMIGKKRLKYVFFYICITLFPRAGSCKHSLIFSLTFF
jgi:hypothetical protein